MNNDPIRKKGRTDSRDRQRGRTRTPGRTRATFDRRIFAGGEKEQKVKGVRQTAEAPVQKSLDKGKAKWKQVASTSDVGGGGRGGGEGV